MAPGTTTRTTWAGRPTGKNWRRSSNNDDGFQVVPFLLKDALRLIERAEHLRLLGIRKLAACRYPARQLAHRHERAGDFAAAQIRVRMPRDEQLLEQRKGGGIAEHVQRLQDLRRQEATQHFVPADPLE